MQQRYSRIHKYPAGRFLREIGIDLTYLEDYNLPDLQRRYTTAAEALDMVMETFLYTDGTNTGLVRTYDREATIDLDALHYIFELRVFVFPDKDSVKMRRIDELNEEVNALDES